MDRYRVLYRSSFIYLKPPFARRQQCEQKRSGNRTVRLLTQPTTLKNEYKYNKKFVLIFYIGQTTKSHTQWVIYDRFMYSIFFI